MKDSTRFRDDEIRKLIEMARYTAKEIAAIMNQNIDNQRLFSRITVKQVYHAAYRSRLGFRQVERRSETRTDNPGRRADDQPTPSGKQP